MSINAPPNTDWPELANRDDSVRAAYGESSHLFKSAITIRLLESKFLELFSQGLINGTVHTCVGQELIGPTVANYLGDDDFVVSNHRGHGHFVGCTNDVIGLLREVMGRTTGVSGGIGGSQHLCQSNFLSNGIQGGMMPIAAGIALANRLRKEDGIAVAFIGDGTLGEGTVYETLNVAGTMDLPLLVVVENNRYAQSTATSTTIAGSVERRAAAFGADYFHGSVWDLPELTKTVADATQNVRSQKRPAVLEIACYRLNPHSKGDDNREPTEVAHFSAVDPLNILLELNDPAVDGYCRSEEQRIDDLVAQVLEEPILSRFGSTSSTESSASFSPLDVDCNERINKRVNKALHDALAQDERVVLLGEDICDRTKGASSDYGGAFKVTRGLSTEFPNRVINFPISEATMVGMGTGLALRNMRPVVEIMFGDFMTLCFDQLLQHASKFRRMFNEQFDVPLIVRTPMGGKRGYGPTHSQSIEKFFVGIPDLRVVALNDRIDPCAIYEQLFADTATPTLVIENKVLYTRPLRGASDSPFRAYRSDKALPTIRLTMDDLVPDVTLFCYGEMLQTVEDAAIDAFQKAEIICEIICPTMLHPFPVEDMLESVRQSERLVTVEEGPSVAAIGAELVASCNEHGIRLAGLQRLGNNDLIPCSVSAEADVLPSVAKVSQAILDVSRS